VLSKSVGIDHPAEVDDFTEVNAKLRVSDRRNHGYLSILRRKAVPLFSPLNGSKDPSKDTFTGESSNLDFLRSSAVLFVLVFHLLLYFQLSQHSVGRLHLYGLGHWGVLIFFVHTTTVLMFSLERQRARNPGHPVFLPFLARRLFRILPLSIFIVLVTRICMLPVGHLRDGHFFYVQLGWRGLLSNLLLIQNLTHTESILAPLWSLPYELQMYLVLPALFLLALRLRSWVPLLALWICSVFLAMNSYRLEKFGIPDILLYLPCFLPGLLAYKLSTRFRRTLPSFVWIIALALATAFYLAHPTPKRGWLACLVLGLLWPLCKEMRFPALQKICQVIARYSYGIYLTHFICIWFAFQELHELPVVLKWLVFCAYAAGFPYLLYHYIEAPLLQLGNRLVAGSGKRPRIPFTPSPAQV